MPRLRSRPSRRDAATAAAGLRHADRVYFVFGAGEVTAYASGVAHRYPRRFRVSLAAAGRLVQAGVPVSVEGRRPFAPVVGS